MNVEVTEQGLLIPKNLLEGIDEVEIRQEQDRLVIVPTLPVRQLEPVKPPHKMKRRTVTARPRNNQQTAIDQDAIVAQLAALDRIAAEIGAGWPEGVSAVDAVRDVRRDL